MFRGCQLWLRTQTTSSVREAVRSVLAVPTSSAAKTAKSPTIAAPNTSDSERHMETCRHMRDNPCRPTPGSHSELESLKALIKVDLTLHLFPNLAALETSLDSLLKIYHGKSEILSGVYRAISDLIPVIYVRLHRDKEAYEFVYNHTYKHVFKNDDWDAEQTDSPDQDDDQYEDEPPVFDRPCSLDDVDEAAALGHQVLLTLMAIKVLHYLKEMQHASIALVGTTVLPQEIVNLICERLGPDLRAGPFGFSFYKATGDPVWRGEKISELKRLITRFVNEAAFTNTRIWWCMLAAEEHMARSAFGQYGLARPHWDEEWNAGIVVARHYQAWMETPGAFDTLREAVAEATILKSRQILDQVTWR
ncbi:hypothetical protein diail_9024 [Diaporthe ilicicola]|nr:hypothetical protein diail_9024 [Diaporthe ilicicola]